MLEGYIPLMVQRYLDSLKHWDRCDICGAPILPAEGDGPLCADCTEREEQKEQDYRDERDMAHAATNGTL